MKSRYLWRAMARVALSFLFAALFYAAWMSIFLLASDLDSSVVRAILWLLAPVVTAAGFASGIAILERRDKTSRSQFLQIYVWPLTGCAIGAGAVYWLGPMLIVFGMLAVGAVSVALREIVGCFLAGGGRSGKLEG